MRIFGMGVMEIAIILVIVCLIFGPVLFKKIGKRGKDTFDSAKKGLENGAKQNDKDLDFDSFSKDDLMDGITKLQDRVDDMFKEEAEAKPKSSENTAEKES